MSNGDDTKQLADKEKKDTIIDKYKHLAAKLKIGYTPVLIIVLVQFIFIGFQCQLNKTYRRQMKMNYLSNYIVEQKVTQEDRKKECIRMVLKVGLHYQPKMNERLLCQIGELLYNTGELVYNTRVEEWIILITYESWWKRTARSPLGARGPMQLMFCTAEPVAYELNIPWNGLSTLYNYKDNVKIGMKYYHRLKRRYREPEYYITAYCWGEKNMGEFCDVDARGAFIKEKKISGKYRNYLNGYLKTKHKVEKILKKKIVIEGLEE
jgi:hypothetical protein